MNFRFFNFPARMLAFTAVIALSSCKKDGSPQVSGDSNAAMLSDSSTIADNGYYDVLNTVFVGFSDNPGIWKTPGRQTGQTTTFSKEAVNGVKLGCALYSVDDSVPGSYPKVFTVDFGTGCTSAYDGVYRKGKLIYTFSGPLLEEGNTASVQFDGYSVNGYGLQGQYNIANSSTADSFSFSTQVINGIVTYPNSTRYFYTHNKKFTQTAGGATLFDVTDDVYAVTGNSTFSTADGNSLLFNTVTPLIRAVACRNIKSGTVGFLYNNSISGTIDFGDGTCDDQATLNVGTITRTIQLR